MDARIYCIFVINRFAARLFCLNSLRITLQILSENEHNSQPENDHANLIKFSSTRLPGP